MESTILTILGAFLGAFLSLGLIILYAKSVKWFIKIGSDISFDKGIMFIEVTNKTLFPIQYYGNCVRIGTGDNKKNTHYSCDKELIIGTNACVPIEIPFNKDHLETFNENNGEIILYFRSSSIVGTYVSKEISNKIKKIKFGYKFEKV